MEKTIRQVPRGHYLSGYRDGIGDSVKSWEPAYNELLQRCQQLEQVAKRLWWFIENRSSKVPQATYILGKTAEQLEALGVSLDD